MLIDFKIKNSFSFREEAYFSMEKDSGDEFEEINTFEFKSLELLKSAVIFGSNASGKTNLIKSLKFMESMIKLSMIPLRIIKLNESFKFIQNYKEPSLYEVRFSINNFIYRYGFEILEDKVNKEWLYKKDKREMPLFIRSSSDYQDIKVFGAFKKEESIKSKVSEDALFLSVCKMFNNPVANDVFNWFNNIVIFDDDKNQNHTLEYINDNPEFKNKILNCLKKADIDIEDFSYDFNKKNVETLENDEFMSTIINKSSLGKEFKINLIEDRIENFNTSHRMYDEDGVYLNKNIEIPFEKYQSEGTKKFFLLLGPIWKALNEGGVLIIDEIDAKLHCGIVRYILSLFNSIDINNKNAQIVFTTHDVLLLEENIRRDQVWFVAKNQRSESEVYCLNDFNNVRKHDNILKKYLLGIYGAIPFKKGEF